MNKGLQSVILLGIVGGGIYFLNRMARAALPPEEELPPGEFPLPTGSVSGSIHAYYTGELLSNVTVEVDGIVVVTDINGDFAIYDILPGTYTITFAKSGYITVTDTLWITADREEVLSVSVKTTEPPPPPSPPGPTPEQIALVEKYNAYTTCCWGEENWGYGLDFNEQYDRAINPGAWHCPGGLIEKCQYLYPW